MWLLKKEDKKIKLGNTGSITYTYAETHAKKFNDHPFGYFSYHLKFPRKATIVEQSLESNE